MKKEKKTFSKANEPCFMHAWRLIKGFYTTFRGLKRQSPSLMHPFENYELRTTSGGKTVVEDGSGKVADNSINEKGSKMKGISRNMQIKRGQLSRQVWLEGRRKLSRGVKGV